MDFQKLFEYDQWANRRVFDSIKEIAGRDLFTEAKKLFAHLLAAQVVWMSRVNGETSELEIWSDLSLSEMENLVNQNPGKLKGLISRKDQTVKYQNSKENEFQNSVAEILMHVIIHGQHHRAQIATLLRKSGLQPPTTDFIFFLRTLHN